MVGFAQLGEERLSECMKQLTDQPISIIAKTDCVIYKMKGSVFHQLMKEDLAFCNLMYDILTENYLNIFQRYIQMEEASVPVRICTLLLCPSGWRIHAPALFYIYRDSQLPQHPSRHCITGDDSSEGTGLHHPARSECPDTRPCSPWPGGTQGYHT